MREIKFRAWRVSESKMLHGIETPIAHTTLGNPVMQYIGMKDYTGVDIYDGDIISGQTERFTPRTYIGSNPSRKGFKGTVEYFNTGFSIKITDQKVINFLGGTNRLFFKGGDEIKIMGNIYENPELLKP